MPQHPAPGSWLLASPSESFSEAAILALTDELFPSLSAHTPLGRGHDCAELVPASSPFVLSTDLFLENTHFSRRYFTPEEAGAKALAAAASDLAAAGAEPQAFSLGLILPPDAASLNLRALLGGMAAKAAELGMILSGGDLSRGPELGFSVTAWGAAVDGGADFFRRRNAVAGDAVFVVGRTGLARVGLWALETWGRDACEAWPVATAAHLAARPLFDEGKALARFAREARRAASASGRPLPAFSLMDLSDGLAADLPRLLGSFGADLDPDKAGIHREILRAAPLMGAEAEEICLAGGEDYALLGSCPARLWPELLKALPQARFLGRVRAEPGLALRGAPLNLRGFDHFSRNGTDADTPAPPGAEARAFSGAPSSSLAHSVPDALADSRPGVLPEAAPPCVFLPAPPQAFTRAQGLPAFVRQAAQELIATGREAWEAGLMAGFNGNLSLLVDVPEGGRACLISRSGAAKARLGEEDFCLLSLEDGALLSGSRPSTEAAVHLGIYRACPESRAVLHVHPPHLLAAGLLFPPEERLALSLPEADSYKARMAWTPFYPPGGAELGRAVAEAARRFPAVWMERHGLVVHGGNMAFALSLAEELEQLGKIRLLSGAGSGSGAIRRAGE